MINLKKEQLLKQKGFRKEFKQLLSSSYLQVVMQLGIHENRKEFPVPKDPISDAFQHSALRDAYTQGSIDLFEYFVNFMESEEDELGESSIEPLENVIT